MKIRSLLSRLTLCMTFMFAFAALTYGQSNEANSNETQSEEQLPQQEQENEASFSKAVQGQSNPEGENGSSATNKLEAKKQELENMLEEMDPSSKHYGDVQKKLNQIEELLQNQ